MHCGWEGAVRFCNSCLGVSAAVVPVIEKRPELLSFSAREKRRCEIAAFASPHYCD